MTYTVLAYTFTVYMVMVPYVVRARRSPVHKHVAAAKKEASGPSTGIDRRVCYDQRSCGFIVMACTAIGHAVSVATLEVHTADIA